MGDARDDGRDDGLASRSTDTSKLTRVGFGAALIGGGRPPGAPEDSASTLAHSDTQPNFERHRTGLGKQHTIVTPRLGGAAAAAFLITSALYAFGVFTYYMLILDYIKREKGGLIDN